MILVTGATGNVGRPLLTLLMREGAEVRALTRRPREAHLPAGVDVVAHQPGSASWLRPALEGVQAVFVNPRAIGPDIARLLRQAEESGVRRAVSLSAINVDDDPDRQPSRYRGDLNAEVEAAVTRSDLDWVVLRPSVFCSNMIGLWSDQIKRGDLVHGPFGDAAAAPIDERDVAGVAARALLGGPGWADGLRGERLPLTGPRSLVQRELVAQIGHALGRRIRYVEVPADVAKQRMMAQGFSSAFANAYLGMQERATHGPALVTRAVEDLLGRPPTAFAEWSVLHAAAFRRAA